MTATIHSQLAGRTGLTRDEIAKLREMEIRRLSDAIADLASTEMIIMTNEGTFGATEAGRAVGTADPRFATRIVRETVGGEQRESGPAPDDAPGRMRRINLSSMREARARLKTLRAELKAINAIAAVR